MGNISESIYRSKILRSGFIQYVSNKYEFDIVKEFKTYLNTFNNKSNNAIRNFEEQDININYDEQNALTNNNVRFITDTICSYFGTPYEMLCSRNRANKIVMARHFLHYFLYKCTLLSLLEVGQYSGGRDHSTIINSIEVIDDYCTYKNPVKRDFDRLASHIFRVTPIIIDKEVDSGR